MASDNTPEASPEGPHYFVPLYLFPRENILLMGSMASGGRLCGGVPMLGPRGLRFSAATKRGNERVSSGI